MDEKLPFETYLLLTPKKISITVIQKYNLDKIYEKEVLIDNDNNDIDYNNLIKFLDDNIFEIEKITKNFIKKINLIFECVDFFSIGISVKNNGNLNLQNKDNFNFLLNDVKEQCKKTYIGNKIVHMIIKNYRVDNLDYLALPKSLDSKNFSLDLEIICLSNTIIKKIEKVLIRYQISLDKLVSFDYLRPFLIDDKDLIFVGKELAEGYNNNEIQLVRESRKNKGFFERFFNLFN